MGLERRGRVRWSCFAKQLGDRMTSIDTTNKPFMIDKRQVYEAYKAVKSNKGAAGVDAHKSPHFFPTISSANTVRFPTAC